MESLAMLCDFKLRRAQARDLPGLHAFQALSLRRLGAGRYSERQIEAVVAHGTMDEVLVADGTYFVAEAGAALVGCGGWSLRTPRYAAAAGGAVSPPGLGEATIRSVFVHPHWTRQGIATAVMAAAERDARGEGAEVASLAATLSGVDLYLKLGYRRIACFALGFDGGVTLPVVHMRKRLVSRQRSLLSAGGQSSQG